MGVKNFQIIFDNPTGVFMPGQTVTGRVLIVVSESVKIRSIKMKFKGEAENSWTEEESRRDDNGETHNYTVKYEADEEYFENKNTLVGGGGESHLEEGEHVYPFSVSLPFQLPSTFHGQFGHVRYVAKVVIDIPWGKDKEVEKTFEVISPLNLNDESYLAEPKKEEKEKFYCCCCCESGPMTMVVCVPYTGYVPGQIIPLTIELDNNSNVEIEDVKIKLERVLSFKARSPSEKTKYSSSDLVKLKLQGIEAHASKTWTEQLTIPKSLTFSNLKYCGIITDKYVLKVEAVVGSVHENTEIKINILMGNIPLTIAQDAPQFGYPSQPTNESCHTQPTNASYPLPSGQFPTNPTQPLGFIQPTPIPGFAQQIPPYGPPPFTSPYQQPTISASTATTPYSQPSLHPQTQGFNEPQLPYPNINVQQPAFNPAYQNPNPVDPAAPTAPFFQ